MRSSDWSSDVCSSDLKGDEPPLLLKSNLISTVHRAVPLDLAVVPIIENGKIAGLSIHAGLWTSAALNAPPQNVPVLRTRLTALEAKFGRSEEHTSELQSLMRISYAVFCLKKKKSTP